MAFKFLHTSDIHFGASRNLTPKSFDYLKRHKEILNRVLKVALKEKVDFILVSGDIFESASTRIEELLAAHEFFTEMGEICPVVVTAGNHDELSVGDFQTRYLRELNIPNVVFVDKPQVVTLGHRGGPSMIAAIPWTGIKDQAKFDQVVTETAAFDCEIVMLHECFVGITLDSGKQATWGVQIPNLPHVRYYAVGDIHKHQRVQLPNAFYSGAPFQYNFGDKLPKGVMVVDVDDDRIYTPRFVEIPSHIELHNITSLDQIPPESPHWYKLRCDAASMPGHLPPNVKVVEPIPKKVDLPEPILAKDASGEEPPDMQVVDFTEGLEDLLASNGFEIEEIKASVDEVRSTVAGF